MWHVSLGMTGVGIHKLTIATDTMITSKAPSRNMHIS